MATAEEIVSMTVLHQIGLQRYSNTVLKRILSTLRAAASDIEGQIKDRVGSENEGRSPQSLRLVTLLEQVRATQREAHQAIRTRFNADVTELAGAEVEFVNGIARISAGVSIGTNAALATVSADQLRSAVMSQPFQGKTLREWTDQFEAGDARRMKEQITIGYLEGESVPQMTRRIRTIGKVTERGAEALVRTSVTHIDARAVAESAKANPQLFKKYQWISVLDHRTTPVCQARAGNVYEHGKGPLPPAHVRCRSGIYNLVAGVGPAEDLGYGEWLSRQSAEDQRDILGPSRYKLYRDGGLKVDRFVDSTGRSLTLDELKKRDAEAFRRAGL